MFRQRLTRSAGVLAALTGAAALLTGGIALAHVGQQRANQGRGDHTASTRAAVQRRSVARTAGSSCAGLKFAPAAGAVAVNGHTVRVTPTGAATAGSGAAKKAAPAGAGAVAVNDHTVRASPTGTTATRPC